ncbi:MAG: sacsin N-terminal ATP-binding-like domain-containing protein [Chitinophagaceae bacterium]
MSEEIIDREQLERDAIRDAATADMKQHADKLIHGFEGDDHTHSRRAIWELVQNARDLSDDCEIEIAYTESDISFTHNGKPFTSNTLLSLIKQVSSKSDDKFTKTTDESEVPEVGQYGTGFITTHAFGKRFVLNGSLHVAGNTYITLKGFEVDRNAKSSPELASKLEKCDIK